MYNKHTKYMQMVTEQKYHKQLGRNKGAFAQLIIFCFKFPSNFIYAPVSNIHFRV